MQHSNLQPLEHYNDLLSKLKAWGPYQIRLLVIMTVYWMLSGLNEAVFELTLAQGLPSMLFFFQQICQILLIMATVLLSPRIPRTLINLVLIAFLTIGCIILTIGVFSSNKSVTIVGQFTIVMMHYPISLNLMMIILEYQESKSYSIIWCFGISGLTIGRLLAVCLNNSELDQEQWTLKIVMPCLAIYIVSFFFVSESPRFWIDQNIAQAEKLLNQISRTNSLKYEPIEQLLQKQFFWHKVTLTKYNLTSLINFKSISYNTYIISIQMVLLGIICRCPDFIQHLREGTSFQVDDALEVAWVSSFQIIAILTAYFGTDILKRKTFVIANSAVLLLMTIILAVIQLNKYQKGDAVIYSMTIFGLNSFFSMMLFYFLILSALEFYPHTIRTIAFGALICLFKIGKLLFSLHIEYIEKSLNRNEGMVELVLCCSLLLLLHSFFLYETSGQVGRYDLPEIEQKQYDDFVPV